MEPSDLPSFSDPSDVARFIEGHNLVGILVAAEKRESLFASLAEFLAGPKRRILRLAAVHQLAILQESVDDLLTPPPAISRSAIEWRDVLIAGLRVEQQSAQERIAAAKTVDAPIDSFERDVASWLAAGLRDLFEDEITGASFLADGKGVFARLSSGVSAVRFIESDFLRPDGIRFLEASRPAQSMLTKLTLASTNQYRVAASRLLNRILELIDAPRAEAPLVQRLAQTLTDRGEELILLMEEAGPPEAYDWLRDVASPIRVIVAITEGNILPIQAALLRYADAPIAPILPDPAAREYLAEKTRAELFIQRGLLRREDVSEEVGEIRQRLADVWRKWFTGQLEDFDAEGFLTHEEEVATLARHIAAVTRIWEKSEVALRMPENEQDFADADRAIAEIRRLDRQWRVRNCTPIEEGMAFDAAVAAGGAPLDMLTEGVRWWLRNENKDWEKYRIVRIDEFEAKTEKRDDKQGD